MNEAKREADFERLQRTRRETALRREHDRSIKFQNAQDARQKVFQSAERLRGLGFHKAERQRAEAYKAAQASRDAAFYSKQDELQDLCVKSEIDRTSVFEAWASTVLQSEDDGQTERYKREEGRRETKFVRAMARSALRNDGI